MHSYAQTNVQLFNQLQSEGYSGEDRELVRQKYEFAMSLFTGLFLPSGKTFIDHLVGTASILASLHVPVEVVAAGLLHAAYLHGDFGFAKTGISDKKRAELRREVGDEIEEYIARYDRLLMTPHDILLLQDTFDQLGPIDRYVVLMRLANELEHHLDFGGLYFAHGEKKQRGHQRFMESRGPQLVALAERLGFYSLAADLARTLRNVGAVELPLEPCIRCEHTIAYLVAPRSYRQRFSVFSRRKLSEAFRWSLLLPSRVKWWCGRVLRFIYMDAQTHSRST
jgi:(p)ppGpp synthase/HD superfamily hydrolase